ncbi:MAG: EAL domain-containing protein [Actinomycetota bacterium]
MISAFRRRLVWAPLVGGSLLGVVVPTPFSDLVLGLVVLSAMGLTVSSARSLRGLRGWRLIVIGSVLIGFAPVITEVHRAMADPGPLTIGDAVLFVGYALFIAGVRTVLTARTMDVQARATLDATLISLWVGFLTLAWAGPELTGRLSGYPLAASLLYLPLSLAIVYYLLRLVLGSDSRSGSVLLLASAAGMAVVSEISFLVVAAGYDGARRVGVSVATLALVTVAAAVRHPSAPEIETPVAGQQEPLTLARSLWLVLSFVVVALSFVVFPRPVWYLALLLAAIGVASSVNLFKTIQERERLIVVERTLRVALADVIRASDPTTILERAGMAADQLLVAKDHADVELARFDHGRWIACPDGHELRLGADAEWTAAEARRTGEVVREEGRSDRPGIGFATDLAIPIRDGDEHVEVLFVEASPVLTTVEIEQLTLVTGAVSRALVSYALMEANHQRRADRRFRALVQDSSDVVAVLDPETRDIGMVSPSLHRILGYREEAFVGAGVAGQVHPDDVDELDEVIATALTRPQTTPIDVRLRHVDGHYQWFSALVRDHTDDEEVGGLVLNLTDIHRRKLAELSLGFSEQRYRALVLNSRDVFAVLERDFTINYVSPNVKTVLGYPAHDLMATDVSTLLPESSAARLRELVAGAEAQISNETIELEVRTRHGDLRIAEVTVSDRTDDESGFLVTLADVTERRNLESSLRDQALYDSLTGLANRSTLHHELQTMLQGLQPGRVLGLLHIDIHELKEIVQSVGFEAGDELLIQVATRLRSRLRSSDLLARVGSNELAVAVEGASEDDVFRLARLLKLQFDEPFPVAGRSRRLGAAIGVDVTDDRSTVASDVLNQASLAAATVLDGPGTAIRTFEPALRSDATTRFELASDLEEAASAGQLHVVYQPILEIASSTVRGVEALLRWNHPNRGPISPGMFIPLAEKSGQIRELGRWVLREACRQLTSWDDRVPGAGNLGVSVNVSAIQLEEEGEAGRLAQIVDASGLAPGRITLELTESTLIEDPAWMRAQLEAFRDLGMRVAVDDFGTGAAGLSHLRDVPFNVIKIDKSYVDALSRSGDAERLVRGVIDLAHTMQATTVAEGIEEPRELELLRSLGCDLGQGFYLGRPMEPTQLEAWFDRGRAGSAPALIAAGPARHNGDDAMAAGAGGVAGSGGG